ncbi:MAG: VanZ family protein [Thermomonas haemolytica]
MNRAPYRVGRSLKPFRRPWLWAGLWMLAIALVVAASLVPGRDLPDLKVSDKTEHLTAYALLAAGAVQVFARRRSWAVVCVLLVLMGIAIEFLQGAMGLGRTMDRYDALANTIGVLVGLATAFTPLRDALLWLDSRLFRG